MPTVNNRGRLFWGSAFGCEPRRGNAQGEQPWAFFWSWPAPRAQEGQSKAQTGLFGGALSPICGVA